MKKLSIRLTSKLEAEYFTSRLTKAGVPYQSFELKNGTDTEIWVQCLDIRITGFQYGMIYFEFLRYKDEPATIGADIKFIENFSIWAV